MSCLRVLFVWGGVGCFRDGGGCENGLLFITSLAKGGYIFGSVGLSVCLFVCLFVDNITQKVMNGLG